ncbi:hypothetical protein VPNG_10037 [Cytospora leucostoma]|uniref:Uncharacterized protein n=1 Tax=Cytospora leucostoma TaxID=1230097 RepID=A0A423VHL8_9PEZI|nr:hypothetical protein VPNG_10037 [Cytospora leucostoma]
MKATTLTTTLLFTCALSLPNKLQTRTWSDTELGLEVHNVGFQGDGFYQAIFDDNGSAEVKFTPMSELLNTTTPVVEPPNTEISARGAGIVKRAPTCDSAHHGNWGNMDIANVRLAQNAAANDGGTGYYPKNAWGWVFYANEASFFCNYEANYLTYSIVIDFQTAVSAHCGQTTYGYDRCANDCGVRNAAIGRTWYGNNFCTSTFRGY